MARPTVTHDGFLVPNASKVLHPRMAEPDQIDFATAANQRWGVIEGCLVTVSGTTASMTPGVALVNGVLVISSGGQQPLAQGGSQDRFDLLAVDSSGGLVVIPGDYATDPVFPDVGIDKTLLAAVFCPTGVSNFLEYVMDKRRFINKALLTQVLATDDLIRNLMPTNGNYGFASATSVSEAFAELGAGDYFVVTGDGKMTWQGDARLYRSAPYTIKIENHLQVVGNIDVGGNITGQSIAARGLITGQNLSMGAVAPAAASVPVGSLFQRTDGHLLLNTVTGWLELATLDGMLPTGTVIQSVEPPGVMEPKGWCALAGQVIQEKNWPTLFALAAFAGITKFGIQPERTMTLPDAGGKVLMGGGVLSTLYGGNLNKNTITLRTDQIPSHNHRVRVANGGGATPSGRIAASGRHSHTVAKSGRHPHDVNDPGHKHVWGDHILANGFICLYWEGKNKLDALFNDRNHTHSVEVVDGTRAAMTGITISDNDKSDHDHTMSEVADHDHPLVMDALPEHSHTVTQDDVGLGATIDITPAYMGVYVYIRA